MDEMIRFWLVKGRRDLTKLWSLWTESVQQDEVLTLLIHLLCDIIVVSVHCSAAQGQIVTCGQILN